MTFLEYQGPACYRRGPGPTGIKAIDVGLQKKTKTQKKKKISRT